MTRFLAVLFLALAACSPALAEPLVYDGSVSMWTLIRRAPAPVEVHVVWRAEPYLDTIGWARPGSLTVIGLPGPAGERPTFDCPSGGSGITVKAINGVVNHLRVEHLRITGCSDGVIGVSEPDEGSYWTMELVDLEVDHNGDNGIQTGGGDDAQQWSRDVLIVRGGHWHHQRSALSHNFYVGHIERAVIEGVYSHDSGGGSSLKINSRYYEVRNNRLATTDLALVPPDYRGASGLVLDITSCTAGIVAGNTIEVYNQGKTDARGWGFGRSAITFRNRHSDAGCDWPPYGNVTFCEGPRGCVPTPDLVQMVNARGRPAPYWVRASRDSYFWDPSYWATARAAGIWQDGADWVAVAANPWLYLHFISGNRIVNVTPADDPWAERGTVGIIGAATAPRVPGYSKDPAWMERPDGWFERAVVLAACNSYEGRLIPSRVGGHNFGLRVPSAEVYDNPVHEIEAACPDLPSWFRR